jgi:chorismate-pyruvate lyase
LTELCIEDVKDLLHPLVEFWSPRDDSFDVERLAGDHVPEPYRSLLVHDRDMTPTLEAFWDSEIGLDVLARQESEGDLMRHVVLRNEAGRPVAFGAIRIRLAAFPRAAREDILSGRAPLGALLREHGIEHRSHPAGFFRMAPNAMTRQAFGWPGAPVHYGRHNRLSSDEGLLAEVVEILPRLP